MGKTNRMLNTLLLSFSFVLFTTACSKTPLNTPSSSVKIVDESLTSANLLKTGSFSFAEYEYDSGAIYDADVLTSTGLSRVKTDVRGRLYLPNGPGPFPLVVFLHGNHSTCGFVTGAGNPRLDVSSAFTTSGQCPSGYIETPSYRGYDDSARLLASWGYAVTSINANRGITGRDTSDFFDSSLIYARGNLVLRHIEELAKWSRVGQSTLLKADGLDLAGKLDVSRVGLMGHSRGGEGVRYAYNIFTNSANTASWKNRIPGLQIQGIFEIGPVDMGTNNGSSKVEAQGVAWTVLIPGCDSDVSDFSGVRPFERMETMSGDGFPKSVFTLWGANHNFFNTQWQVSDAPHRCVGSQEPLWDTDAAPMPSAYANVDDNARSQLTGSDTQIKFEKALLLAFFHAHLGSGKNLEWDHIFDPQYRLPSQLSSLASSSREYVVAKDSTTVFNAETFSSTKSVDGLTLATLKNHLAKQISLMSAGLANYGSGTYKAVMSKNSFVRSAMVIEGDAANEERTVNLPFKGSTSSTGYWTVDLALASQRACYEFDANLNPICDTLPLDDAFEVALVLADGSVTRSVAIENYVKIDNWYANYFQRSGSQNTSSGTNIIYSYVPVLYQTARFELSDFGLTNQAIQAVQLQFKSGRAVSLIVESIRLSKRP